MELRIEEMEEKEQVLQARIEALQADNDFTNERLAALQGTTTHRLTGMHGHTLAYKLIHTCSYMPTKTDLL